MCVLPKTIGYTFTVLYSSENAVKSSVSREHEESINYCWALYRPSHPPVVQSYAIHSPSPAQLMHYLCTELNSYADLANLFLSDPSPIIGNACQWLTDSLTDSLTNSLLLLRLMMRNVSTTVWLQIWKVNFGHKIKFLFGLWGQGFKVCSRFWSWCSGTILKMNFGHYFAADAWLWLWS